MLLSKVAGFISLLVFLFVFLALGLVHFHRFSATALGTGSQSANSGSLLEVGHIKTYPLSAGEAHSYRLDLKEGQYVHLTVESRGVVAVLAVTGPQGQPLLTVDCRDDGPTPMSVIAEVGGSYRFEASGAAGPQASGFYILRVKEIRAASTGDQQRVEAEKLVANAERLQNDWNADSSTRAIAELKNSVPLWSALADSGEEIRSLRRIGAIYLTFSDYRKARSFYVEALSLCRKTGDLSSESEVLAEIAYIDTTLRQNSKALEECSRALRLSQRTGNRRAEARALGTLGEISYWAGDLQTAIDRYQQSLIQWRALNDVRGQAQTYTYLGYSYSDLGQVNEAAASYEQALSLWRGTRDRRGESIAHIAVGRLYERMGESQKALSVFLDVLPAIRTIGDLEWEASTVNGMAYIFNGLGQENRAIELYLRSLALFRRISNQGAEAGTLGELGRIYFHEGNNQTAIEYLEQSAAIFRALGARRMEMVQLKDIGRVYEAWGNSSKALENYERARAFFHVTKDLRNEAISLNLAGGIYEANGQDPWALEYYNKALNLLHQAASSLSEATTLYKIARLEMKRGRLAQARVKIESAIKVSESVRVKVASSELRASYLASVRQQYELYIDVLMRLRSERNDNEGFEAQAFDISERAHARSLLEALKEVQTDIRAGVDGALIERQHLLKQFLNAKATRRAQLVTAKANKDEIFAVDKEINQLSTDYEALEGQIKAQSPRFAALTQPQPLSLPVIQQMLEDDSVLLLEYALGDERSYVWVVSRSEVSSFELPGRAQIEDAARKLYKLLAANHTVVGETLEQRRAGAVDSDARVATETTAFSRLVLAPILSKLGKRRLIIVPDGALQYIPFQALTVPASAPDDERRNQGADLPADPVWAGLQVPLMVDHEIVNEPSASALALVLSDVAQRTRAPNSVAVFANPVFEPDDPRVKSIGAAQTENQNQDLAADMQNSSTKSQVQEAFRDIGFGEGVNIPPLPASREEADAIMSVVPWRTGLKAVGFDASRATITGTDLSQYRIVHFATHGFVDYEHPELSGLVLSLVDQQGRPQDGYLRMHDIYNLRLPVDLVVLSACNTALGKDVKGEGLIGLTRGFMYAGAGGVAASLWKVDDEATAELMKHFYDGMFSRNLTPAAALREAQIAMWQQKRWHAPYYWAAFVLQGEYNQKLNSARKFTTTAELSMLAALLMVAVTAGLFLYFRYRRSRLI
jgi:CHAT domain-containing protein